MDIVGSAEASLLLTLFLFIPGYVLGWVSDVFQFQRRRFVTQCVLSTPLSIAMLPIVVYLVGRIPSLLWLLLGACWVGFAVLALRFLNWRTLRDLSTIPRTVWAGASMVVVWAIVAMGSLVDLQFANRLYFTSAAYDFSFRTALTAAASKSIPAANPFFANSPPVLLRYHYFWMLLCSLVTHLGVTPRQAMLGGTIWAGLALMCLVALTMKFFIDVREGLERKVLIGCGLLAATGLDILPTIFVYFHYHTVHADMEWWNGNEQITSWVDTLLWAPHHLMALVACVLGFLILQETANHKTRRAICTAIAGFAFASAVGLSVLVTFTFAAFVIIWLICAALRKHWNDLKQFSAAGTIAFCLALPYLHTLLGPATDGKGGGGRFFATGIRDFPLATDYIASLLEIAPLKLSLLPLALLPLNYFLELGFFFVVAALRLRSIATKSIPLTRNEETGWMLVATSFLIGTFLRSTTIGSNDLGWRCFEQAQLVLLLWAAVYVDGWWSIERYHRAGRGLKTAFAGILLGLGVAGTLYQVTMLRMYPIWFDTGHFREARDWWLDEDGRLGERNYLLRSAYWQLGHDLPADAIVQYNPHTPTFAANELYSWHDAAMGDSSCGAVFGGSAAQCEVRDRAISPLFKDDSPGSSLSVDDVCREYHISAVLVKDTDPVWGDPNSWVWIRTPVVANDRVRAFDCGDFNQQARFGKEKKSF